MDNSANLDTILEKATALAKQFAHESTSSCHLLLAILKTPDCKAYQMLEAAKVPLDKITEVLVGRRFTQERGGIHNGLMTAMAKSCISQGATFAQQVGSPILRTEYVLLGLLTVDSSIANDVFGAAGINPNKLINRLSKNFGLQPEVAGNNTPGTNQDFTEVCYSLTAMAKEGKLDPVIGRKKEIERVQQVLSRRRKNNPVLIGEAGVGKTAIAEGLALNIVNKTAPPSLLNKEIFVFDVTGLVSGTVFRGQLEARVKAILDHVKKNTNIILFIDEIHLIVGAGNSVGGMDLSNMMKTALSRGDARVIGATTTDEYNKNIAKDSALERRFQPVHVDEPSDEDTLAILHGSLKAYEQHHGVTYSDEAKKAAVLLSKRYIPNRRLPDKAIDVLDEAGSALKLAPADDIQKLDKEMEELNSKKNSAALADNFTEAAAIYTEIRKLKAERERLIVADKSPRVVKEEHVMKAVSLISKVPVEKLNRQSKKEALGLEAKLRKGMIGQGEALTKVANYIKRNRTDMNDPKRPIGSFLLLGPTGVGKTLLAKMLAVEISGSEDSLITLDMSEYMEKYSVSRLIGSPPGYVGYDDQGSLVERVRRNPYSVILFDEIEKAHPDVWNALLQVLEEGRLTDGQGRVANFRNTIILLTSNLGYTTVKKTSLGFNPAAVDVKSQILEEVKKAFRPEFINRLDEIVVFSSLSKEDCTQIVGLELEKIRKRSPFSMFSVSTRLHAQIMTDGFSEEYGARELKRALERLVADSISDAMLKDEIPESGALYLDWQDGKTLLSKKNPANEEPALVLAGHKPNPAAVA